MVEGDMKTLILPNPSFSLNSLAALGGRRRGKCLASVR